MAGLTSCSDRLRETSESSVAVLPCGAVNSSGGQTGDLTGLDVAKQYVLLDFLAEICENDVVHVLYVAVLREKAAAADGSSNTVQEGEKLLGRGGFNQDVQNGDHLLLCHGGAVRSCSEAHKIALGKAGPRNFGVLSGLAYGLAMVVVDENEQRHRVCHRQVEGVAHDA